MKFFESLIQTYYFEPLAEKEAAKLRARELELRERVDIIRVATINDRQIVAAVNEAWEKKRQPTEQEANLLRVQSLSKIYLTECSEEQRNIFTKASATLFGPEIGTLEQASIDLGLSRCQCIEKYDEITLTLYQNVIGSICKL